MANFSGAVGQNLSEDTLWDAAGDLAYGTASDTAGILSIGDACEVLVVAGGLPSWGTAPQSTAALDNGTENITSGGTWSVDVDATGTDSAALYAAGTLRFGVSQDLRIYHGGTHNYITGVSGDLVLTTDGDGNGIILDAEDDTVEIKGSGTTQATFSTAGLCVVSGDYYSIAGNSVLNATTLGSAVVASSLTSVGTLTGLTLSGDMTLTGAALDVDLIDNNASAMSFDSSGQAGIIDIVTTNCSEGVTMSGTLGVTGVLTATGGIELSHASQNTLTGSSGCLSVEGNVVYRAGGTDVPVADGGTGRSCLTTGAILIGNGTGAVTMVTQTTKGQILIGDGSGAPQMLGVGSNCEVLIACSGETTGVKWGSAGSGCARSVAGDTDNGIITWVTSDNTFAAEANLTWDGSTLTVTGDLAVTGACITLTGAATDIDLVDNNAAALSFDASGAAGLIVIDTRNCAEGVTMSGTLGVTGAVTATAGITVGSAGSGADVTFHSATSGDNFLWDSSCEKLVITGTNGQTALCVADGDVLVVDTLYFYDRGGEYISSNGSTLAITGATTVSSTLGVTGAITANAGVVVDNFTLDGTELDLSSGDFTLDVAGDIEVNADGGCINFKDASLALAAIVNTSCVGELRLHEAANYIGLKPPALSANQTWTWPATAGCACEVLTCNGSGVLSWAAAGGGAVSAINNATANELVTIGGTTTELCAEAGLTYDAGAEELILSGSGQQDLTIRSTGQDSVLRLRIDGCAKNAMLLFQEDSTQKYNFLYNNNANYFAFRTLSDNSPNDGDILRFLDTTQQAAFAPGAVCLPTLTWIGDTDAGFFNKGSNLMGLAYNLGINQLANDEPIVKFHSTDVAHSLTDYGEACMYGYIKKANVGYGILCISGFGESGAVSGMRLQGLTDGAPSTNTTNCTNGSITLQGGKRSGTAATDLGDTENLVVFRNMSKSVLIIKGDGDIYSDGTVNECAWDDYCDVALLTASRAVLMPEGSDFRQRYSGFIDDHAQTLHDTGVITLNDNGHHFVSTKGLNGLMIDSIRQLHGRIEGLESQVKALTEGK